MAHKNTCSTSTGSYNTHVLELNTNKFLTIFKPFNNAETREIHFEGSQLSKHIKPETTMPLDRYVKM
jgi:hypothetical protein